MHLVQGARFIVNIPALLAVIAAVLLLVAALQVGFAVGWLGLAFLAAALAFWFWGGTTRPRI